MGKYDDRPYQVGKGKPPVEHRWPKGTSGNAKGPKRKADRSKATMIELLAELINEKVKREDGTPTDLTMKEYILARLLRDAAGGTAGERLRAFKTLAEYRVFDLIPADKQLTPEQQQAAIDELVRKLAKFAGAQDPVYAAELRSWGMDDLAQPLITDDSSEARSEI